VYWIETYGRKLLSGPKLTPSCSVEEEEEEEEEEEYFSKKTVQKIQVSVTSDKNNEYFK
jgi:hypothetical protein